MKLQHPQGRVVDVPENIAEGYLSLGWEPADGEPATEITAPSKSWKVDELKAYAAEHGIDLGTASKKDEILAVIEAATSPEEEPADGEPATHEPQIAAAE